MKEQSPMDALLTTESPTRPPNDREPSSPESTWITVRAILASRPGAEGAGLLVDTLTVPNLDEALNEASRLQKAGATSTQFVDTVTGEVIWTPEDVAKFEPGG